MAAMAAMAWPWQVQALPRQQSFSSAIEESERVEPPTREQLHRPWHRRAQGASCFGEESWLSCDDFRYKLVLCISVYIYIHTYTTIRHGNKYYELKTQRFVSFHYVFPKSWRPSKKLTNSCPNSWFWTIGMPQSNPNPFSTAPTHSQRHVCCTSATNQLPCRSGLQASVEIFQGKRWSHEEH